MGGIAHAGIAGLQLGLFEISAILIDQLDLRCVGHGHQRLMFALDAAEIPLAVLAVQAQLYAGDTRVSVVGFTKLFDKIEEIGDERGIVPVWITPVSVIIHIARLLDQSKQMLIQFCPALAGHRAQNHRTSACRDAIQHILNILGLQYAHKTVAFGLKTVKIMKISAAIDHGIVTLLKVAPKQADALERLCLVYSFVLKNRRCEIHAKILRECVHFSYAYFIVRA